MNDRIQCRPPASHPRACFLLAAGLFATLLASPRADAAFQYQILKSFTPIDGTSPLAGLAEGSDGALYGTTSRGGDSNYGTVFVLRPAPLLLPPILSAAGVLLRVEGRPGSTNKVQRTTTLGGHWQTLSCLIVPTNGMVQFLDAAPPQPNAFYRAIAR